MDPSKKKKIILVVVVACVAVAGIVAALLFVGKSPTPPTGVVNNASSSGAVAPPVAITDVVSPRSAYSIAALRAAQWKPDAAAIKVSLADKSGAQWSFIFVSPKTKGQGFQVVVSGQNVMSAAQISYAGGGSALPANITSPDAAMAAARAIPGYANTTFISLEMVYNATAKQWYWGVKTANGITLTIKATP